jgi:hypothetical protein
MDILITRQYEESLLDLDEIHIYCSVSARQLPVLLIFVQDIL